MSFISKKFSFCCVMLFFSSLVHADDVTEIPTKKKLLPKQVPHTWLSGDLLYWKAMENRRAFVNHSHEIGSTDDFTTGHLIGPKGEWNPGIRLNLGYQPQDWTFFGTWTYINNRATKRETADPASGFFPVWVLADDLTASSFVTKANMRWKQSLNIFDVGTSRPWLRYGAISANPYLSLRSVCIEQTFSISYSGGMFPIGIDRIKMRNNFWGMGPHIGIKPAILLGQGFSLLGDAAASCLLGRFKIKQNEKLLENSRFSDSFHHTRFMWELDFSGALSWQKELYYKILLIGAQVGWEWHKFYSVNQLHQNDFHLLESGKSLIMRGFFVSLCVAF